MSRYVEPKWRPPLMLILGGSLLAILVLPVYAAIMVLGWLLWRLILAPVQALAAKAELIRDGEAPSSIDHYGTPEIGELAQAVLDMAEVLQSREMAVRGYTDHVTHELKTPLTAIRGAAELLGADEELSAESRHLVDAIAGAEKRAVKLLGAAREIAAARMPEHRGTTSLSACLQQLRERFPQIEIDASNADEKIPLAKSGLEIVLGQLTQNAVGAGASK